MKCNIGNVDKEMPEFEFQEGETLRGLLMRTGFKLSRYDKIVVAHKDSIYIYDVVDLDEVLEDGRWYFFMREWGRR